MTTRQTILAAAIAAAIGIGASTLAFAHEGATSTPRPHDWHQGWHMGPMMGPCMMGPRQMGQGQTMGPGQMMGPDQMGQGQMMGPGAGGIQPLRQDLSAADVQHMMEHHLSWQANPNVKVGQVVEKDDDTITAEIVTLDGSLVQKLQVDRHTGVIRPAP